MDDLLMQILQKDFLDGYGVNGAWILQMGEWSERRKKFLERKEEEGQFLGGSVFCSTKFQNIAEPECQLGVGKFQYWSSLFC